MTPNELLASVLTQFQVMYLNHTVQENLLRQALGTYQDKAGIIRKLEFADEEKEIAVPKNMLEMISVSDAEGRWHEFRNNGETISVIEQTFPSRKSKKPFMASYLVNLRDMDIEKDELPSESIGLLREYLESLISIPNTARARQIAQATGLQTEYSTEEELRTRKDNIELAMEDSQAIIPMATVF